MASFATTPYQTTLSTAIDASQTVIKTAASTGFVAGYHLVIGKEVLELTKVNLTTHYHEVKRGMRGTQAVKHVSGAIVSMGAPSAFGPNTKNGVEVAGYDGDFGVPTLPIGSRWVDPDTGYEYLLCDSGASYAVGDWVSISVAGAAIVLAAGAQGRIGCVAEAVGASDKLFWVQVVGKATGYCTTDVTVAMPFTAGAGVIEASSSGFNSGWIRGLACTTAHATSCTAQTAVFYLNNPFITEGDYTS